MKKYQVGYVAGVFDVFHVGHLNLLERAKAQCEFLIVGVLTDELVLKNKNIRTYIPFEERLRVVAALKVVDRAVGVDDTNIQKMDAWNQFHFDCLFSGDDYRGNRYWEEDKAALNTVGSDIVFFPYTKSTSSTQIREAMGVSMTVETEIAGSMLQKENSKMKIWAHRGCSFEYPENTLLSFRKAAELIDRGLCGIETDIQLTKDGYLVVIHDESIDRTTDGKGCVRDYTLDELRQFHIFSGNPDHPEQIPTIEEVLDLLEEPFRRGLMLNIELKNSFFSYEGMEEKILKVIEERGLNDHIVYSSFSIKSVAWIKKMNPKAHTGILGGAVSDLYWKYRSISSAEALHPIIDGMDVEPGLLRESGMPIRAWMRAPLFTDRLDAKHFESATGEITINEEVNCPTPNVDELGQMGITDLFVNNPQTVLEYMLKEKRG